MSGPQPFPGFAPCDSGTTRSLPDSADELRAECIRLRVRVRELTEEVTVLHRAQVGPGASLWSSVRLTRAVAIGRHGGATQRGP